MGRLLASLGASTVKRVRTELGGKSAALILEDATEKQIAMMASHVIGPNLQTRIWTRKLIAVMASHMTGNTGQSCNALSRMLIPRGERYHEIQGIVKKVFQKSIVIDANDPNARYIYGSVYTDIYGSLISRW